MSMKDKDNKLLDQLRNLDATPFLEYLNAELTRIAMQLIDVEDFNAILRLQGEARRLKTLIGEIKTAETEAQRRLTGGKSIMQKAF